MEPVRKKHKKENSGSETGFISTLEADRVEVAESILSYKFNNKRVRCLSEVDKIKEGSKGIVYWMTREQRVQDNWSLLFTQKQALKCGLMLHICFCLRTHFMDATLRHYKFMFGGLKEVAAECQKLNISFHLLLGNGEELIPNFVKKNYIGAVVIDFSPLRDPLSWIEGLQKNLSPDIPIWQVDGHNIVPCWIASDKLEYGARTIRNKINSKLDEYLTKFPPLIKHSLPEKVPNIVQEIDWAGAESSLKVDKSVDEVDWAKPGYKAGMKMLHEFCEKRLKNFSSKRNDPTSNALSNLSPWFHFGQISIQRCILIVKSYKSKYKESVESFCEEAIIRRELADNFCFYNSRYDKIDGAYDWAKKTLDDHRKDKRVYIYTKDELEKSMTHDDLWNSAQIQLVKEGKMHGYLRMYWAKKILEWTNSPEEALEITIYLNDKYSMDGRDPNGFVGCMWSICGIHDQGWKEREVFGKIRYMNYVGCKRKFDVSAYVSRYGGKLYNAQNDLKTYFKDEKTRIDS